jgi:hypothetical protein
MTEKNKLSLLISTVGMMLIISIIIILNHIKREIPPYINSVPQNAAIIFEFNDFRKFESKFLADTSLIKDLKKSSLFRQALQNLISFDSLCTKNEKLADFISENRLVISIQATGKDKTDFLYIVPVSEKYTGKDFAEILSKSDVSKSEISNTAYENAMVYTLKFHNSRHFKNTEFSFSVYNGLLLFSTSDIPVNQSIRQLKNEITPASDENFKTVYQNIGKNNNLNIYINYKNLGELSTRFIGKTNEKLSGFLSSFGNWSGFELKTDNQKNITLNGITSFDKAYLQVFSSEKPITNDVMKFFPEKTSAFVIMNIDNGTDFQKNFTHYSAEKRTLNAYKRNIEKMYLDFNVKITDYRFIETIGGNIALVYEDINKNGTAQNVYAFAKILKKDKLTEVLDSFMHSYSRKLKVPLKKLSIDYESEGKTIKLSKWPAAKMMSNYFGDFFSDFNAASYTFIDDYLVFGSSIQSLRDLFDAYQKGKTLENRVDCKNILQSVSDKSNVSIYLDAAHSLSILSEILNSEVTTELNNDSHFLSKLRGPVFQFTSDSKTMISAAHLNFDATPETGNGTVWECRLDSLGNGKPFEVINKNTGDKEILIQDRKNNLHLIDKNGKILWTKKIGGKILGTVYQVDYLKNGKLQYLFNTKDAIYLIDRNAANVSPYPVKLKSEASCGISVFDYDKNRNYRIFLATGNKKVSLLNIKANAVGEWKFEGTVKPVLNSVQYFSYKGKDYIVFSDGKKTYILDHQGKIKIKPAADFPAGTHVTYYFEPETKTSKARFVTTNISGDVIFIYLDGTIKKMTLKNCFPDHYFVYSDIDGDQKPEFIYVNKNELSVYDRNNSEIFSYKFSDDIIDAPEVYKFSNSDSKIGIVSRTDQKIYLFNCNGKLYNSFPLSGNTPFVITKFDADEQNSLITGCGDKYLYKYPIY